MTEPPINVFQGLWSLSHTTWSYVARAIAGGLILAYGMGENDTLNVIAALLFIPFLSPALGLVFGLWGGDTSLSWQAAKSILTTIGLAVVAGATVAFTTGIPMKYDHFQPMLASVLLSAMAGFTAGVIQADHEGRLFILGVAASAQVVIYPVWFGWSLVKGFPDSHTTTEHLGTFALSLLVVLVFGLLGYLTLGVKRHELKTMIEYRGD